MGCDANYLHWNDVGGFLSLSMCLRSHCDPGWSVGRRWSRDLRDLDLWLIVGGRGTMRARRGETDRSILLHPGVALVLRPGWDYDATHDVGQPLCVDAVHFDLRGADGRRLPEALLPPMQLPVPDVGAAEAVSRRLRARWAARCSDAAWAEDRAGTAMFTGLLLDLEDAARRGAEEGAGGPHWVARAEAQLREDPASAPTVAAMAAAAGCSPDHFARQFKRVTGRSPQAARIAARLDHARNLLRSTPMAVSQVADALGYRDVYFFSRQFKRFVGVSPSAYRRRSAADPPG